MDKQTTDVIVIVGLVLFALIVTWSYKAKKMGIWEAFKDMFSEDELVNTKEEPRHAKNSKKAA